MEEKESFDISSDETWDYLPSYNRKKCTKITRVKTEVNRGIA